MSEPKAQPGFPKTLTARVLIQMDGTEVQNVVAEGVPLVVQGQMEVLPVHASKDASTAYWVTQGEIAAALREAADRLSPPAWNARKRLGEIIDGVFNVTEVEHLVTVNLVDTLREELVEAILKGVHL